MTSCGPGGSGVESCCTSLGVPGGTFFRSYDGVDSFGNGPVFAADGGPTLESSPATVSAFRLDEYLVTVGRFRQFVAAWKAGYTPPEGSGKHAYLNGGLGLVNAAHTDGGVVYETGWIAASDNVGVSPTDANLACTGGYALSTWTPDAGTQEDLPINCVSWQEARAFCIWDDAFLPSSAEWEFAAAGGSEQRLYPWGRTPAGTTSQYAIYACYYSTPATQTCTQTPADFAPVGTPVLGAGRWGQLDLTGDVDEWTLDLEAPFTEPCVDCAALPPVYSGDPVIRGDDFASSAIFLAVPYPYNESFGVPGRGAGIGFRCARSP
jgi:formylglycine-generating enzyme required for sulfatase activity